MGCSFSRLNNGEAAFKKKYAMEENADELGHGGFAVVRKASLRSDMAAGLIPMEFAVKVSSVTYLYLKMQMNFM